MLCLPRQLVRRGSPVSSRRSSSSASATSIDGSGPPRSRAARERIDQIDPFELLAPEKIAQVLLGKRNRRWLNGQI